MSSELGHDQHAIQPGVRVLSARTFEDVEYQIALEDEEVGRGASASILKGRILGGEPYVVALKVVHESVDPKKQAVLVKLLVRELRVAREVSLCHENILGFLGTATIGKQTAIVSLYMKNGNLIEYAKNNPECDKKKLILQVGEGVEFLHVKKKLVHGDLKCENVLISDYGDALLADFGLGSVTEKSDLSTTMTAIRQMNTFQFAAPEILGIPLSDYRRDSDYAASVPKKTTESDVYAFGMLIIQAISEKLPWGRSNQPAVIMSLSAQQHPGQLFTMSYPWWDICKKCWNFMPDLRPKIGRVLRALKANDLAPSRILPFREDIAFAVYTPDGTNIIALSYKHDVVMFEIATSHTRHLANAGQDGMPESHGRLAVSPDGRNIACCIDKTLLVLDTASGVRVAVMEHDNYLTCLAYSRDGMRIASGTKDGSVRLWNAATGAALAVGRGPPRYTTSTVSFSPDGSCLASSSLDGSIRLWDSVTCTAIRTVRPKSYDAAKSLEFSPVDMRIATVYGVNSVTIWDVRKEFNTHCFDSTRGRIAQVAFSPHGQYVAWGSDGGHVEIWDVEENKQVAEDPGPAVYSCLEAVARAVNYKRQSSAEPGWAA